MNEYKVDMGEDTQSTVMEQAIYDMIMYMPMDKLGVKSETSIEEIIEKAKINVNNVSIDESILQSLIEFEQNNPDSDVLKATISNMSYTSDDKLIQNPEAFSAAVFTDVAGNKSVNFRGTPDRAWMDNADGLSGIMRPPYELDGNEWKYLSDIDKAALDYYQWIREDVKLSGKDLTIGGHSKGGHEALLVALLFSDDIIACYAFDGQSISPEMWNEIKELYKDDPDKLQKIRDKITAVNLDNDYVHVLGWTEENGYIAQNVYVIKGGEECALNPLVNHFMQAFFNGKGGLNPVCEDGEGPIAGFLLQVSDRIMKLESPKREKVANSIMLFLQFAYRRKWPVNFTTMDLVEVLADLDEGLETAVDILADVINNTEEGTALVEYLKDLPAGKIVQEWLEKAKRHPLIANVVLRIVSGMIKLALSIGETVVSVSKLIVFVKEAGEAIVHAIQSGAQWLHETGSAIVEGIKNKVVEAGRLMMDFGYFVGETVTGITKKNILLLQYQLNRAAQWIEHTTETVLSFISDIAEQFKRTFASLKSNLTQGIEKCKERFANLKDQVIQGLVRTGETLAQAVNGAKEKIEGFAVSIKDEVTDAVKTGQNVLKQGMDLVKAGFKNVTEVIKETAVNEIKKAADTVSGALTTARKAVFDSADKIKDSLMVGCSILTDTVASFGGWLKETGTTASAVTMTLIKGTMTGKAGIYYAMLDEALARIEDFTNEAACLEREIDYVLADLSGLRYARVSTSHLSEARTQVTKQRSCMNLHSMDLKNYKNTCRQTETEFVQALNHYA